MKRRWIFFILALVSGFAGVVGYADKIASNYGSFYGYLFPFILFISNLMLLENPKKRTAPKSRDDVADPPQIGEKLLYLFLDKKSRESLPGDLQEEFETTIVPKFGVRYARFWYWWQVLRSIGPLLCKQIRKFLTFAWIAEKLHRWIP